ncbi:hypothetical protein [Amycolatopsis taiwanensis]|uniref:hypothetical protein n=1 Tax=Amycolatopsis taiwanensis TaxID=342230 RepID=UPI000484E601|nr:hypothetical protein [Amycolatopsis taiwanensis]
MNDDQIRALLAVAMGYDNRRPGELNIAAWTEASARGRWTFDAALEAIHAHYAENTEFLMPAHITRRVRAGAGQPPRYEALPPAQPASEDTRRRMRDLIGNAFRLPRHARGHRPAPDSAEHQAARQRAREELDQVRHNRGEAS